MMALIPLPKFISPLSTEDWSKKTLRQCLTALGFTDTEMRFRKGARTILADWTGEEETLLKLAKEKWKKQAIKHHEASGGDPEKWKNVNAIYSAVIKKLSVYTKPRIRKEVKFVSFKCIICNKNFKKKITYWAEAKSTLCKSEDCRREYHRIKTARYRSKLKTTKEKYCQNPECNRRFFTTGKRGDQFKRFCSNKCRLSVWTAANADKIKQKQRDWAMKQPAWKVWFANLTDEQKAEYRKKNREKAARRKAKRTPEQIIEHRMRQAEYTKKYRQRRAAEGNPVPRY